MPTHDKKTPGDDPPGTWLRRRGTAMTWAQMGASLAAALLLILAGLYTLAEFLAALIWSVIFAIAVWPLYARAAARWPKRRKHLLPFVAVLGILLIFVVPLLLITGGLAHEAHGVAGWAEQVGKSGLPAPDILVKLPYGEKLQTLWQDNLGKPGRISALITHTLQGNVATLGREAAEVTLHDLMLFGFMLLALYVLLSEAESVVAQLRAASRRTFGPAGEDVGLQMVHSVQGTVTGLVLVGLGEGAVMTVIYLLTGLPEAMLFGLVTAVLMIVPYAGTVPLVVAVIVLLGVGKIVGAVVVGVTGYALTFAADHFIRPVLIGGATRLPFLWVLLGIIGGLGAWGLVGLFLGPAIMAALILLWREWIGAQKGAINPARDET